MRPDLRIFLIAFGVVWMLVSAVVSTLLYLEGAREFRGLSPRRWLDYVGALAAIGVLAFLAYVAPNPNARTVIGGAYVPSCTC
jgi:hypothetical protein